MVRTRILAALLLCAGASSAQAEITFVIEEPQGGQNRSGIGLISGWAISDAGIESVEGFIDGESIGLIPYGSGRGDVQAAFPDIPDSLHSGWGMKWGYSLGGDGEHTLRIVVTEVGGATASREVTYNTVRFESRFIRDPETVVTAGKEIYSPEDGVIVIEGAEIDGQVADVELAWDTASQQFLVNRVTTVGGPVEKQPPTAQAGANLSVEAGSMVTVTGEGSDPDGYITARHWSQLSGAAVVLNDFNQWTVSFTAPDQAGTIHLRLKVTDNDGLSDTDDVVIEVTEPEIPNQAPQASAGPDFTVQTGHAVEITGAGSDPDGEIVSWYWSRVGGAAVSLQNSTSQTVRFTAPGAEGYVMLRLTVTDDDGATGSDYVTVHFDAPEPVNQAPTANAGDDRTVETGDSVTVTGNGSDPDGSISSWSWTQVSGTTVSLSGANSREVSFTAPGSATTVRLRLTVTDDAGATDSDDVLVTVTEPASGTTTGATLQSMLDDLNAARGTARTCGSRGSFAAQPPLEWSSSLAEIAMIHSMDMAAQGYFDHNSIDGTVWSDRIWPYWNGTRIGENIAASSVDRSDAHVIQMWLDSDGHCAMIMDPNFTHAGIGVGRDEENGFSMHHFWTLDFGG